MSIETLGHKIAVGYARYSSNEQREESIDAQVRYIKEYCEKKGYILIDLYVDEAKSGTTTDSRDDFKRMIEDSQHKRFNVAVVHKINRFARNRFDSAFYKRELKLNGVRLESVTEPIDDSPESIIMESVLEGMAEYFSKDLAREVRKGLIENALKAQHSGGRPPLGYKVNPETRRLEIDEETAPAVRFYFESILKGYSSFRIAKELNEMGYRTQLNRPFKNTSFKGWHENMKYKGIYTWDVVDSKDDRGKRSTTRKKPEDQQIIIPGGVPAIVSEEVWDKVNQIVKQRKKGPGSWKAKVTYFLSGKLKCGHCGANLVGASSVDPNRTNPKKYRYYECKKRCSKRIRKEMIEEIVFDQINKVVLTEESIQKIIQASKEKYLSQFKSDAAKEQPIVKQIAELDVKINNWIEALGLGIKSVAKNIKEAEQRKAQLELDLTRIRAMKKNPKFDEKYLRDYLYSQQQLFLSSNEDDKKQAVQELVRSVVVSYDKDTKEFNFDVSLFVF